MEVEDEEEEEVRESEDKRVRFESQRIIKSASFSFSPSCSLHF